MKETPHKTRADAWWAPLSEERRWELYEKGRSASWSAIARFAATECGVSPVPRRSAVYAFLGAMRAQESAHRREQAILARREAKGLADAAGAKAEVADAFMALGADVALRMGDASAASDWIRMATQLLGAAQKDREIELRAEAQRLDREKFEAAERRLAQMAELSDAARGGKVDPATVADEIDRILGRKK